MSNARMTISALFATVQASASTITNTVDAINKGVNMVNKTVSDAAEKQAIRSDADTLIFKETLLEEKSKELAESSLKMEQWMNQSNDHKRHYEIAFNKLDAVLNRSAS